MNCRDLGTYGGGSEQAITMQVERDALEEVLQVENSITTAFEYLQFIIETLHKTAIASLDEIIEDLLPPMLQCFEEHVKTFQLAGTHSLFPGLDFDFRNRFRNGLFKNVPELFLQVIR